MENATEILFAAGFGFVASAIVSLLGGLATGGGSYRLSFASPMAVFTGFAVCMFAGPYLTLEGSVSQWLKGRISDRLFLGAIFVAGLWSFCAGVFVIQLLRVLGIV